MLERIEQHGDLFAPVLELEQQLPRALASLAESGYGSHPTPSLLASSP